jgi:hypothetical protein
MFNTFNDYQYVLYTHTQLCMNHNSTKDFFLKIDWPIIKRVPKKN